MPVVHERHEPYDVYVGPRSFWRNPFQVGRDGTLSEVTEKFDEWLGGELEHDRLYLRELAGLDGKTLGCHCGSGPCHADVLAVAAQWAHEEILAGRRRPEPPNQGWCIGCSGNSEGYTVPCFPCGFPRFLQLG